MNEPIAEVTLCSALHLRHRLYYFVLEPDKVNFLVFHQTLRDVLLFPNSYSWYT